MLSDEEKNSMELDIEAKYVGRTEKEFLSNITYAECLYILDTKNKYCDAIKNLSLLKIVDIVDEQSKEIEELKENNKLLQENYSSAHEDINWFCENYISKEVSEQKERKAYIKGTNDAHELCNKKWEDKIKAKTIEIKNRQVKDEFITASQGKLNTIIDMESLLEKE